MVTCAPVRMRLPLSLLITVPATLAACDALVRVVLWWGVRRSSGAPASSRPLRRHPAGMPPGRRRSGRLE
ncbi:MAG: hypothetical protein ACXWN1_25095, partial [Thermoanaerobaculia bacterium]